MDTFVHTLNVVQRTVDLVEAFSYLIRRQAIYPLHTDFENIFADFSAIMQIAFLYY